MRGRKSYLSVVIFLGAGLLGGGCYDSLGPLEDESLYLTGTEEAPVNARGGKACRGNKVLICHIPPGNPARAHTICVGSPAVDPHVRLHGDLVGPCDSEPDPPPTDPPPHDDPDGDDPDGDDPDGDDPDDDDPDGDDPDGDDLPPIL
jgi:hypothetical protein